MNPHAHAMPTPPVTTASSDGSIIADDYFARHFNVAHARLLAPIDGPHPAGTALRGTPSFRAIEEARRSDDPTLPMGQWAVELKHANWPKTSTLIVDALCTRSKDLQLASWLLEAEIHQRGFSAISPCIGLMRDLCEHWWEGLHPQPQDGDHEPRANVVRWINDKLLATLSLVPLVSIDGYEASWSGWELAHHHERIRAAHGDLPEEAQSAPTLDDLQALLAHVPPRMLRVRHGEIAAAREAVSSFETLLREHMANDAPTLSKMETLLTRMQGLLHAELKRRGEPLEEPTASAVPTAPEVTADELYAHGNDTEAWNDAEPVQAGDRDEAYRALAEIAEYLMHIEPHSPVPYLIRRAIAWGQLDAARLYQDLFLKAGGQISIFELMGLAGEADTAGEEG